MEHDKDRERIINILNGEAEDTAGAFQNEKLTEEIQQARREIVEALGENLTPEKIKGKEDLLKAAVPLQIETLGRLLTILERAEAAENERRGLRAFFDLFVEAAKTFHANPDGDRWEARAKRFFNALGITTGSRQTAHNKAALFYEYMDLLHGWDKGHPGAIHTKWEALEILQERHDMASPDAVLKHLRRFAGGYEKGRFKGVFPGNRQK